MDMIFTILMAILSWKRCPWGGRVLKSGWSVKKGHESSYILNYRYSTLALIGQLLPSNAGILRYQDLSYKLNMPTQKAGTFSLWGIGAYDVIDTEALEPADWKSTTDRDNSQTSLYLFASGLIIA